MIGKKGIVVGEMFLLISFSFAVAFIFSEYIGATKANSLY